MEIRSKLPRGGDTIFSVMSALASEYSAINLGQGFPDFDCDAELRDRISHHLNDKKNQYCPMAGLFSLRKTLAFKIFNLYGTKVDPATEITITAGATQAIYTAITAFVHEGDEVIIIEPAYDCYKPAINLVKGIVVPYVIKGPGFKIDWDVFEDLITPKTSMIVINTPHNPIGKTLKSEDLLALNELVKGKNIVVLSDEVYEHLIYDNAHHQSVLRYADLYNQSMAVYSFGKTFHSTGWKIGYIVAPQYLMEEFRKVHQWNVFSVNSFVQYGLNDYLKEPNNYLHLPKFYQKKRDYFNNLLSDSRFKPILSEGTYFQLYDYSEISDDDDVTFAKRMTCKYKVASIPVSVFYSQKTDDKFIRLCFAKTEKVLEKVAELILQI
ncbi:MAG: methionine aminotransferase [Saprospiraceae bacterium]